MKDASSLKQVELYGKVVDGLLLRPTMKAYAVEAERHLTGLF